MNKNLFIAGGAILVAGGIAYYIFLNKNGNGNGNGGNGDQCIGQCFYEGVTDCDQYNNLCKCINGKWTLLEKNSSKCISGLEHKECFLSIPNNIITCIRVPGSGTDKCKNIGFSTGCSCTNGYCDVYHLCEPTVYRCIEKKTLVINADNTTWDSCGDNPDCSGMRCTYSHEEVAANTIQGTFFWEYGFWGVGLNVKVYGYLEGRGWNYLGEGGVEMFGDTGNFPLNLNFAAQGISKLRFDCCADFPGVNVKPRAYYGTLIYTG